MLKYRILTALVLIPLFIALLIFLPPIGFCVLTTLFVLVAAWEWSFLMGVQNKWRALIYPLIVLFLLWCAFELPLTATLYGAIVGWLIAFFLVIFYPRGSAVWGKSIIARGVMGALVLVPCWLALNFIRNVDTGIYVLMYLFVLVWIADSSAYFIGRKWGKNKLAPKVSPGKSWQGFIGELIVTLVIALATLIIFKFDSAQWLSFIILSIVTVLFSVLGDLFESMLKRNAGLKDSGHLLPGHGGILDRIDSLTAAAPAFAVGGILLTKLA